MSNSGPHAQIARKIRSVETARTELVQQVAEVFRALQSGNEREIIQTLGGLVGISYFLGSQMGISLSAIDREVQTGLPRSLGQSTANQADFEAVQQYLDSQR